MRLEALAIRDVKSNCFPQAPFYVLAIGMGVRAFGELVNDRTSEVGKHPADFELYHVGAFDQVEGKLVPREGGVLSLGNGLAFVQAEGDPRQRELKLG